MNRMPLSRSLVLLSALLGLTLLTKTCLFASAEHGHQRKVNLVTTNYDLVDTSYIDRGRMDRIRVGDVFEVTTHSGKTKITKVVVTAVYDRMSAVKIQDSWLLKDGLRASAKRSQRPLVKLGEETERRPAPDVVAALASPPPAAAAPIEAAPQPMAPAPDAASMPDMTPAPGGDLGLPPAPGGDLGLPPAPGGDLGLPPAPGGDFGLPPAPGGDLGLPPAPSGDLGLPPAPGGDLGLPPAPGGDLGLPPAPGGDLGIPPPPSF